jgi:hypothetical protein
MRSLIVLLSITAILVCPHLCAVKYAAAQAMGGDGKPACCDKCEAHRPTTPIDDPARNTPAPDEDGRWCLCEGAVFDAGSRSLVDDSVQVTLWIGNSEFAELSAVSVPAPRFERTTSPQSLDGRSVRIAIRSLLL